MRGLLSGGGDSRVQIVPWSYFIMKVQEICKYCEYLHFTTQMTWTRALLLQGLQAAGGPHITKDPVSISNPDIKLLI